MKIHAITAAAAIMASTTQATAIADPDTWVQLAKRAPDAYMRYGHRPIRHLVLPKRDADADAYTRYEHNVFPHVVLPKRDADADAYMRNGVPPHFSKPDPATVANLQLPKRGLPRIALEAWPRNGVPPDYPKLDPATVANLQLPKRGVPLAPGPARIAMPYITWTKRDAEAEAFNMRNGEPPHFFKADPATLANLEPGVAKLPKRGVPHFGPPRIAMPYITWSKRDAEAEADADADADI